MNSHDFAMLVLVAHIPLKGGLKRIRPCTSQVQAFEIEPGPGQTGGGVQSVLLGRHYDVVILLIYQAVAGPPPVALVQ